MIQITVRDVSIENTPPLVMIGMGDFIEDENRDVIFMADLRHNNYAEVSNWPEGESYCVTDSEGRTSFGGVRRAVISESTFTVLFSERTAEVLGLSDAEVSFNIAPHDLDHAAFRSAMKEILTCGRPIYHPQLHGFTAG
ncbi:hypothetical protein [Streptomyces sp. NPDC086023]|uniref:hypothetical protein n=1 Tax=Streptomyces sp. NPDC086023 TaxID=3365746 RepID=UPI0037CFFEA7